MVVVLAFPPSLPQPPSVPPTLLTFSYPRFELEAVLSCLLLPSADGADSSVVHPIYKDQIETYFKHYNIAITWKVVNGGELNKTMDVSTSSSPTGPLLTRRPCSRL